MPNKKPGPLTANTPIGQIPLVAHDSTPGKHVSNQGRERDERIVMYHGTTSRFLRWILSDGFDPSPKSKPSLAMALDTKHTVSFPGTYMAIDREVAASYARQAAKHFGGEPVIVASSILRSTLIPDEDEVLFNLGWPLICALGFDHNDEDAAERHLDDWSEEAALSAARDLVASFGFDPGEHARVKIIATAINAIVRPVLRDVRSPIEKLRALCPDYNDEGWESPVWTRQLTSTAKGMAMYRNEMDALARGLIGARPGCYPCGEEACKGRVGVPLRANALEGANFIAAAWTLKDNRPVFDDVDRLAGDELGYQGLISITANWRISESVDEGFKLAI